MGLKRIVPEDKLVDNDNKGKLKTRFQNKMATANTIAELKKCVSILSRHVFNDVDGE